MVVEGISAGARDEEVGNGAGEPLCTPLTPSSTTVQLVSNGRIKWSEERQRFLPDPDGDDPWDGTVTWRGNIGTMP